MSQSSTDEKAPALGFSRLADLQTRAASALVLVCLALGATWLGGIAFAFFWLAAAIAVGWEWQRLIGTARLGARLIAGTAGLIGLAVVAAFGGNLVADAALLVVGAALQAGLAGPGRRLWAAGGFAYAGSFLAATLALRASTPHGTVVIVWLFATVWSTDVFAYLGGRLIGGPRLWARVSPSKTWSGFMTGVTSGGLLGTLLVVRALHPRLILPILLLSVLVAMLAQAGDLFESTVKRRFGVKDASRLIPGHGGVMDRIDGFIVAVVFACLVGIARAPSSPALGLFQWQ